MFITTYHLLSGYVSLKVRTQASRAVRQLLALVPATARVLRDGREQEVPFEEIRRGDLVRIRPGESIPVDGEVVEGDSGVDESLVTGEPIPEDKQPGGEVIGGSINQTGTLLVRAQAQEARWRGSVSRDGLRSYLWVSALAKINGEAFGRRRGNEYRYDAALGLRPWIPSWASPAPLLVLESLDPGVLSRVYLGTMRVPDASTAPSAGLRIGVLAAQAGVSPDALRFYERQGLLKPPQRSAAGYRLYEAAALDRVIFIKRAQALGLTLSEVREILRVADRGTAPCEHVRQTLARRLAEVDARISELEALRATLRRALARSRRLPLARSCICEIIESDTSQ